MTSSASSPATHSPSNGSQSSSAVAKRILVSCWLLSVTYIWIASEDASFDTIDHDWMVDEQSRMEESYHHLATPSHQRANLLQEEEQATEMEGSVDDDHGSSVDSTKATKDIQTHNPSIPEALRPITYNECCVPAIQVDTYQTPKDMQCFGTCYNERACTDPLYPFETLEQKEKYGHLREVSATVFKELRDRCVYRPPRLVPNVTWCSNSDSAASSSTTTINAQHEDEDVEETSSSVYGPVPEPGCSLATNGGGSGAWQHVFIFPSAKLAFCGIPKVGITQWIQFSRFVAGAKDYPSLPHFKMDNDFFRFDKLTPSIQEEIFTSKEWTWAVFLREPAERLLSAYLDKIAKLSTQEKIFDAFGMNATADGFTFENFVQRLDMEFNKTGCKINKDDKAGVLNGMTGLGWCSDPHWRPQIMSCGLFANLDRFNFVGDINNAPDHTKELLKSVDLWESHGKYFINGGIDKEAGRKLHLCQLKSYPHNHTEHLGFQQKDEERNTTAANTAYGHSKNSYSKLDKYYTPKLLKLVREKLYADDYRLYNLLREKKLTDGKQLAMQLSGDNC